MILPGCRFHQSLTSASFEHKHIFCLFFILEEAWIAFLDVHIRQDEASRLAHCQEMRREPAVTRVPPSSCISLAVLDD